jgi:hypothetical protein
MNAWLHSLWTSLQPSSRWLGFGQGLQVSGGIVVEQQGAGDRIEYLPGGVMVTALLEPGVVLGADTGQPGNLIASQTSNAAAAAVGDPGVLGAH